MTLHKRLLSLLLAAVLMFGVVPLAASAPVSASPASSIARLNAWQQSFLRVLKSLALKDAYDTGVLASVTAGQAIYEGGWARYGISVIANNQYGIRANSNWDGKVFDSRSYMLYDSYDDLVRIKGASYAKSARIWRAYDSWDESVSDHSDLFLSSSRYAKVLTAEDYKEAAEALVNAGYTTDRGYIAMLINVIETYGLDALDDVTADENGIVGMIMDRSKAVVPVGGTVHLNASAYPTPVLSVEETAEDSSEEVSEEVSAEPPGDSSQESSDETSGEISDTVSEENSAEVSDTASEEISEESSEPEKIPFEVVWKSSAASVATVDQNGVVTAKGQGIALITATYNGKEAACLVCVGTNAFVMGSDVSVRSAPDPESDSLGKVVRGMPIAVIGSRIYTAEDGTKYYQARGNTPAGKLVTGYVVCDHVYLSSRQVSIINTKTELSLEYGTTYQVEVEVAPADAEDKTLTWTTSDANVVTVDQNGKLTTHMVGNATVRITAASGVFIEIAVHVGSTVTYQGVTTANLNVRVSPLEDAASRGMIAQGTEITLIGEPVDGWYYVKATIISGATVEGYCYGTYIEIPSDDPEPPPEESVDPPIVEDDDMPFATMEREREGVVDVNAGSTLNIRAMAGTGGKKVLSVPNGTPLMIVGDDITVDSEKTYKTWYFVQVQLDGKLYEGYVAADFVLVMHENTTIPEPDSYTLTDMFVLGVKPKTTLAQFRNDINNRAVVIGAVGNELMDWDTVATGDVVNYMIGTTVIRTRVAIVLGDVNCDGEINARDYVMVKRYVLGTYELDFFGEQAARVSGGEEVTARDYVMIKRYVLGSGSL